MAPTNHVRSLDGLRGWAAIAVVFYHGLLHYDLAGIERVLYRSIFYVDGFWDHALKALLVVFNGESAVILFFVLSGFVLSRSLERGDTGAPWRLSVAFVVKRICRLLPAVVVAVVAFRLVGMLCAQVGLTSFPLVSWDAVARNALLWTAEVIGPSWSIQTELAATAIILVTFLLRRRFGLAGLLVMFVYTCFAIDFPWFVGRWANLWPYAIAFTTGMLVAEPAVLEALRQSTLPRSQVLWLAGFIVGRHLVERAGVSGLIAQTLLGGLLIGSLVVHPVTAMARALSAPLSQFLGRVSYSLYLVNVIWLELLWAILPGPGHAGRLTMILLGMASAVGAVLLAAPTSYLAYRWVEMPFNALGRRVSTAIIAAAPAASLRRSPL